MGLGEDRGGLGLWVHKATSGPKFRATLFLFCTLVTEDWALWGCLWCSVSERLLLFSLAVRNADVPSSSPKRKKAFMEYSV